MSYDVQKARPIVFKEIAKQMLTQPITTYGRVITSVSLDANIYVLLKAMSDVTKTPMSKIVNDILIEFFYNCPNMCESLTRKYKLS